jgi:hypothetical protein
MAGMMGGMPAPPGPPKAAKPQIPKLFANDKNSRVLKIANAGFKVVYIIYDFTRKLLWLVSCVGFMWCVPMMFEIMMEQTNIMNKIQSQMMNDPMGMPDAGPAPEIRPF